MKKILLILIGVGSIYLALADTNNNTDELGQDLRSAGSSIKKIITQAQEDGFEKSFEKFKSNAGEFYEKTAVPLAVSMKKKTIEYKNVVVENINKDNKTELSSNANSAKNSSDETYKDVKKSILKYWNITKNKVSEFKKNVENKLSDTKE